MKKSLLIVLIGAGCVGVPTTKLDYGNFHARMPKDDTAKSVSVTVETNKLTLKINGLNAVNNPEVINSSAAGTVDIITATGNTAANVAGQVIKAMAK